MLEMFMVKMYPFSNSNQAPFYCLLIVWAWGQWPIKFSSKFMQFSTKTINLLTITSSCNCIRVIVTVLLEIIIIIIVFLQGEFKVKVVVVVVQLVVLRTYLPMDW